MIPFERAFTGFSNPAVITVAAVLVLSKGLQNSGLVEFFGQILLRLKGGIITQLLALTFSVAIFSAFMNNVGALALLMPVAFQVSTKNGMGIPASKILMPLAFASLLGGMTTLIGTPPNITASSFRLESGGQNFNMFDFSLVGVGVEISALLLSVLGILPVQISFVAAAVVMIIAKLLSLKDAYDAIDWPIIILLGAMIPVGEALESTGTAHLIATNLLHIGSSFPNVFSLIMILITTMVLSDLVNNATAVVLMAPIGIQIANGLGVSIDPFLIAIAIGASCAFLTTIGHQLNTLVIGPGGYRFGDY